MPTSSLRPWSRLVALASMTLAATAAIAAPPPADQGADRNAALTRLPPEVWRVAPATEYSDPRGIILEESTRFRGTMNLTYRQAFGPRVGTYPIDRINWLVSLSNQPEDVYVTGSGTYQVTSSVGMLTVIGHRMTIDVQWGSEARRRRFDSGVVPMAIEVGGAPVDIVLYEVPAWDPVGPLPPNPGLGGNGVGQPTPIPQPDGLTATLRLAVAPVPVRQQQPYTLITRESGFTFGCYEPCRCALFNQLMGGDFTLIPLTGGENGLPGAGGAMEWAIVNFNAVTPPATVRPLPDQRFNRRFSGEGIYQWSPILTPVEGARPTQRLRARVSDSGQVTGPRPTEPATQRFDSGRVPVETSWPKIQIDIADHDFVCLNRVLQISAKPETRRPIGMPVPFPTPNPLPWTPPLELR